MTDAGQLGEQPAPPPDFLDPEEIVEGLDALSAEQKLKLDNIEHVLLRGTGLSPKQLLHEAMCGAITGDRRCPRRVSVMAFVVMTMKSMANHQRSKLAREVSDGGAALDSGKTPAFSAAAPSPEDILIEREPNETVRLMQSCFEGDEPAQMLILGWSAGYRGKELREFVGVDQACLDYAGKRVRRTIMRRYPNGWKMP